MRRCIKMANVSFKNRQKAQPVNDKVRKAEYDEVKNTVTIWYDLKNGNVIREKYSLWKAGEEARLYRDVAAILGEDIDGFDTNDLEGKPCRVKTEKRSWQEGKSWCGVEQVFPPLVVSEDLQQATDSANDNDDVDLLAE